MIRLHVNKRQLQSLRRPRTFYCQGVYFQGLLTSPQKTPKEMTRFTIGRYPGDPMTGSTFRFHVSSLSNGPPRHQQEKGQQHHLHPLILCPRSTAGRNRILHHHQRLVGTVAGWLDERREVGVFKYLRGLENANNH